VTQLEKRVPPQLGTAEKHLASARPNIGNRFRFTVEWATSLGMPPAGLRALELRFGVTPQKKKEATDQERKEGPLVDRGFSLEPFGRPESRT